MKIFKRVESEARSYCRSFPTVFESATGSNMVDESGEDYLDFLSGAGTLNYGHNNPIFKEQLIRYIQADGVTHSLDLHTSAKAAFLSAFEQKILKPRNLDYKAQFVGPTGTNAVEAALKIARNTTGRQNVVAFTNGFHGMSLGSLAATANIDYRGAAQGMLGGISFVPFDGYLGEDVDTTDVFEKLLDDRSSGLDHPAAVLLETVQGEGGVNVASAKWLRRIAELCRERDILLIVDDIQAGCGRTGRFFSFEEAGIVPDIVTMSKSLSGYGLPMALVLMRPELDFWKPGEHNGTFRGHNLAFVTAKAAIDEYWSDKEFEKTLARRSEVLRKGLEQIVEEDDMGYLSTRGRGMMRALVCENGEIASRISQEAFSRGMVIETSGSEGQVVKCLPPLTTTDDELKRGISILRESAKAVMASLETTANNKGMSA